MGLLFFKDLFKEKAKGTNFPVSEAELGVQQDSLGCGFSSRQHKEET